MVREGPLGIFGGIFVGFLVVVLFCIGCFLFFFRRLGFGRALFVLRNLLVLCGRGRGWGLWRMFRGRAGLNLLGNLLYCVLHGLRLRLLCALSLLSDVGLDLLFLGAMRGLLCGLPGSTPFGLGGRDLPRGRFGGGRNLPGFQ